MGATIWEILKQKSKHGMLPVLLVFVECGWSNYTSDLDCLELQTKSYFDFDTIISEICQFNIILVTTIHRPCESIPDRPCVQDLLKLMEGETPIFVSQYWQNQNS